MSQTSRPRFGIMTAPQQVAYDDILRVWREADTTQQIDHAWLLDHRTADDGGVAQAGRVCA